MSNVDPTVALAVESVRAYGGPDLDRSTVVKLLPYWAAYADLTREQVLAVIKSFPVRGEPDGSVWIDGGSGPGWTGSTSVYRSHNTDQPDQAVPVVPGWKP